MKQIAVTIACILGVALGTWAVEKQEDPETVLKEVLAGYEASANADKPKPEPKEELDLDEEVEDETEAKVTPKFGSPEQLIKAGETFALEHLMHGDPAKAARTYRALIGYKLARGYEDKSLNGLRLALSKSLARCGEVDEAIALVEEMRKKGLDPFTAIPAIFDAKRLSSTSTPESAFDWFESCIEDPKNNFTKYQKTLLWKQYGFHAFYSMRPAIMKKAIAAAERRGVRLEDHAAMCYWAIDKFKELETFPKREEDIKFPKSLADFGIDPNKKVVHAKDLGWDDEDATPCLETAFDSDATTIVIDKMDKPWYITGLKLDRKRATNRQIVIKQGVRIYGKDDGATWLATLFSFSRGSNIVVTAENDVVIGHFPDYKTRKAKQKMTEGGSGFGFSGCRNVALVNLRVAYCCCDGLILGGANNFYVDNCDFDGNYRQGASFGATEDIHFRKCRFHNTGPMAAPGSGVDFEPSYEVWPNNNFYFFDCEFADNAGDAMTFATSTYLPVTVYAKRCKLVSTATTLLVKARPGIYWENNAPAPSKLIFEDCTFLGNSEVDPIRFQSTSLFNVTFRNCKLKDRGPFYPGRKPDAPAIRYLLDRNLWKGPCKLDGLVTFENFVIEGYSNAPTFKIQRAKDVTYRPTRFAGEIIHNGRKIPLDNFQIAE